MKRITAILAGAALMMAFSSVANAIPTLTLTAGDRSEIFVGVPGGADDLGVVSYFASFGDFDVAFTTGLSIPGSSYLHLNSVDTSTLSPSTQLSIKFSETGFKGSPNPQAFNLQFGGAADGTLTYSAYYDATNILNAETTAIGPTLTGAGNLAYAATDFGFVDAPGLFSITQEVTISHDAGTHFSSFDAVLAPIPVPEPATIVLLGSGFFGLAIYFKRRKNAR